VVNTNATGAVGVYVFPQNIGGSGVNIRNNFWFVTGTDFVASAGSYSTTSNSQTGPLFTLTSSVVESY